MPGIRIRKEIPGHLVNRIQMAMLREVWWLCEQEIASAEDIDLAVKGSLGFRLASIGPLLTNDLGGNDTNYRVSRYLLPLINSSTEPPEAFRRMVEDGRYGRRPDRASSPTARRNGTASSRKGTRSSCND